VGSFDSEALTLVEVSLASLDSEVLASLESLFGLLGEVGPDCDLLETGGWTLLLGEEVGPDFDLLETGGWALFLVAAEVPDLGPPVNILKSLEMKVTATDDMASGIIEEPPPPLPPAAPLAPGRPRTLEVLRQSTTMRN